MMAISCSLAFRWSSRFNPKPNQDSWPSPDVQVTHMTPHWAALLALPPWYPEQTGRQTQVMKLHWHFIYKQFFFPPSKNYQSESPGTSRQQQLLPAWVWRKCLTARAEHCSGKNVRTSEWVQKTTQIITLLKYAGWIWGRCSVYLHYGSTLRSFQDYLGSCYKLWFLQRLQHQSASSTFLYMIKPLWQGP